MATQAAVHFENAAPVPGLFSRLGHFWASLTQSMMAYGENRSRYAEIQALERKSDRELADMGLKREDIARFVFRDLFYL